MSEKKSPIENAIKLAVAMLNELEKLLTDERDTIIWEVKTRISEVETLHRRLLKLEKLFRALKTGRTYVEILPDGEYRQLTQEEVRRKIMGYAKKGVNIIEVINTVNRRLEEELHVSEHAKRLYCEIAGASDTDVD